MTPEQIDELLGRMPKHSSSQEIRLGDGLSCYPIFFRQFVTALSEHADITVKPLPDPCEVAAKAAWDALEQSNVGQGRRVIGVDEYGTTRNADWSQFLLSFRIGYEAASKERAT